MTEKDKNSGQLASFYTKAGWFCTIKPAYEIGKVRIDFVKMNTKGSGFSIFVDMDRMDLLCDDILSFRFAKALEGDKENEYPQAWNYLTGKNACKELHIGSGKKNPIVIHGRDKTKTTDGNGYVGVMSYDELRIMAKDFKRTSESYFRKRSEDCLKAATSRQEQVPEREDLY